MAIFLNNEDQEKSITPEQALEALTHGIRQLSRGDALRRPRIDNLIPTENPENYFSLSSMEGGIRDPGYFAVRMKPDVYGWVKQFGKMRETTYNTKPGLYGGLVILFNTKNAELLAIMNDGYVQHLRVAATAALGIKHLSREDSRVMGIYGSGGMARFFPFTAKVVRPIERLQVYSPNRTRLEKYFAEMTPKLNCELVLLDSPEKVARDADIVASCTTSMEPILQPDWVRPGMHLNSVTPWEFSPEVCAKISIAGILVRRTPPSAKGLIDDGFGMKLHVMSWIAGTPEERAKVPVGPRSENRYVNARIVDCCNWITDQSFSERREPDEITVLANHSYGTLEGDIGISAGIQGVQFASIAGRIYEGATAKGLGHKFPDGMFVQDIPT
jgi:ornithine cyclodeaminase/alanine dehydrogenase-like protein (mu-crystallin family)